MRSILLHIADDDSLDARTQVALDLARAFAGHVTCLHAVPYEYCVEHGGGFPALILGQVLMAAE